MDKLKNWALRNWKTLGGSLTGVLVIGIAPLSLPASVTIGLVASGLLGHAVGNWGQVVKDLEAAIEDAVDGDDDVVDPAAVAAAQVEAKKHATVFTPGGTLGASLAEVEAKLKK